MFRERTGFGLAWGTGTDEHTHTLLKTLFVLLFSPQLKILRSKDRVDANGIGRSKGFAFVEFSTHEPALTALRATNNNPSLFANRKVCSRN
jgi:hypothetical protein